MWKQIEDIEQLSQASNSPYSMAQLMNIALHVIKATNDYERVLGDWYTVPLAGQNGLALKTYFQNAHRILKNVRGNKLGDIGFHQAN